MKSKLRIKLEGIIKEYIVLFEEKTGLLKILKVAGE